jgi:hypothetical protein
MKGFNDFARLHVPPGNVWTFMLVAVQAGKSRIVRAGVSVSPDPIPRGSVPDSRTSHAAQRIEAGLVQGYASPGVHNRQNVRDIDVSIQFGRLLGCQRTIAGFIHWCMHPDMIRLAEIDCQKIAGGIGRNRQFRRLD